ncbi:ammonium transporter [Anaerotignum sp.]|uniref:ammonium transporter n=1 Tax=Anaerotignum sp. TaxID=2039241 RepID=UPI0027147884|nr:ammonium transporter [Anaerotignum sp.]
MINSGNTAFVLISAALVCLMTPGLAFFYGGLVRRKNTLSIMTQCFVSMGVVTAIWVVCGFSLVFGPDVHGLIGNLDYAFLNGVGMAPNSTYAPTIPFIVFFIFQVMFAVIAPALITGAFADRMNFKSYLILLVCWSFLVYIPVAHWVWGGGFLQQMGVKDFAGGLVIHLTAGIAAMPCVLFIGKRHIMPDEDQSPHNITYVALGAGLIWFGWFGFNGGSALAADGVAAMAFVNTGIAASIAMVTWLIISWRQEKSPSLIGMLTGAVAGLVLITPAAGYVQPWAAILIGIISSIVCYFAIQKRKTWGWDDALDVWGIHGVGGIAGSILVGVFAESQIGGFSGLIEGNTHQLIIQLFSVLLIAAYSYVVTYALLKVINAFAPVRVSKEVEIRGLDLSIYNEQAYKI